MNYHPERDRIQGYEILFSEPYTCGYEVVFEVTWKFYRKLLKMPKSIDVDDGNAYIFGRRFSLDNYRFAGGHGNDGAQTGFIDITGATADEVERIRRDPLWLSIYEAAKWNWDDRAALESVRRQISPRILFVGRTEGGDVGADLYIHKNSIGEVDGVIIENCCLYRTEEDEGDVQ
jgi:hypothetical protein